MGFDAYTDRLGSVWPAAWVWILLTLGMYLLRPRDSRLLAAWWGGWLVKTLAALALAWVGVVQQALVSDAYGYYQAVEGLKTVLAQDAAAGRFLLLHHWWSDLPADSAIVEAYQGNLLYGYDTRSMNAVRWMLPLGYASGGNFYVFSLLHATLGFMGSWWLFRWSNRLFQGVRWPVGLLWLFIPSTVFWTAGPSKDTLVLFAMGLLATGGWVVWKYIRAEQRAANRMSLVLAVLAVLVALWLVASIRVFWLAAWAGVLAAWAGVYLVRVGWRRSVWYRVLRIGLVVAAVVWAATAWYYRPSNLLIEITYQRARLQAVPAGTSITPSGLRVPLYPEPTSEVRVLAAVPSAFAAAFYGPLPGQLPGGLLTGYTVAVIERLCLLLLSIGLLLRYRSALWRVSRWPGWVLPFWVFALTYGVLLAFTVVFWGALVRYMALVWPFWALALLGMASSGSTRTDNA